jgi:hypothetical protein
MIIGIGDLTSEVGKTTCYANFCLTFRVGKQLRPLAATTALAERILTPVASVIYYQNSQQFDPDMNPPSVQARIRAGIGTLVRAMFIG